MTNIDKIRETVPLPERLAQLAEEAAELAQAALKLRRALDGTNPTPVPVGRAWENLAEECADVALCIDALDLPTNFFTGVSSAQIYKASRWVDRLEARHDAGKRD